MAHLPTTTAGVRYLQQLDFEDASPGIQIWFIEFKFDGPAPNGAVEIRFSGGATNSEKQAIERQIINDHLAAYEPLTPALTNAKIQVSGRPA